MAENPKGRNDSGPTYYGFPVDKLNDSSGLPDFDTKFLSAEDLEAFVQALAAPDPLQSPSATSVALAGDDAPGATPPSRSTRNSIVSVDGETAGAKDSSRPPTTPSSLFISAKNDWAPTYEKVTPPEEQSPANAGAAVPGSATDGTLSPRLFSSSWLPSLPRWKRSNTSTAANNKKLKRQQQQQQQRRRAAASAASAAAGKRARAKQGPGRRTQDETREGYLYGLLKWPFLLGVFGWIIGLSIAYLVTRLYVSAYEQLITWRGRRKTLRHHMRSTSKYADWVAAANDMDAYLGNDRWKEENEFAFYDFRTVRRVADQLRRCRTRAEAAEESAVGKVSEKTVGDLKALVEACVKNNFAGLENRHLYSRTYYGTKNLVQSFVDEVERSLLFLIQTNQLDAAEKRTLFKRLYANYGRTALCLSGGASFAYYHFGVIRALLDEDLLPDVITGTSGGALVAALVATRTNDELRQLLVPALANNINACSEPFRVWFTRWWRTGARFDSVDWARQCSWWTRGSMTFREAYERTGRILNITCIPADPHSPTILCNYRTAPDCVVWSAVLASAAVPGILNPVVLMMKTPSGRLEPYSFGHKWKDGSLRTDIPIKALNLHFNVNFTIVSQVNPHVNLFFFSSRGSVGQPVTHRKGRGWRGGYLGSAFEEYLKQDLRKWLKLLRNLELLPRPLGQDWSQLWLQPFSGTITVWPKSSFSDFLHILTDPDPARLARMLHEGQQSAYPPLKFISNRLRIERLVQRGRTASRIATAAAAGALSENGGNHSNSGRAGSNSISSTVSRDYSQRLRGQRHAISSSIDSLLSDDDDVGNSDGQRGDDRNGGGSNARRIRRLARLDDVSGLGMSGRGSTTATSDENLSSDSDLDISSGGMTARRRTDIDDEDDDEDEYDPMLRQDEATDS